MTRFVVVLFDDCGGETPVATIWAPGVSAANELAWAMYSAPAFVYAADAAPDLYAEAREREFVATHRSRLDEEAATRDRARRTDETMTVLEQLFPWLYQQD